MSTDRIFIPDLQYWGEYILKNSNLNKYNISIPSSISEYYLSQSSFIELLFNDNWDKNNYSYLYKELLKSSLPNDYVKNRLSIYNNTKYYLSGDSTSEYILNLFELEDIDLEMLDRLLEYRLNGTVIIGRLYSEMTTNLSKLIFLYLDFKINNNISIYNNDNIITQNMNNILYSLYEVYLIETMFNSKS